MAAKIKKGDTVVILAGKDKGKTGEVLKVLPVKRRVIVSGINVAKRHQRPTQENPDGGIVPQEMALDVSNVAHLDPKDNKPVRVGFKFDEDGNKVRFAKRSGEIL